jgi:CRP-like cAMP-binding protein
LAKLLVFGDLDSATQHKVVSEMYERRVAAGEILIKEGDTGLAASELYVVKEGDHPLPEGACVCQWLL